MVGASDNCDRILIDLRRTVDDLELEDMFKGKPTEYLMEALLAIREGRYPTKSHGPIIRKVLAKRISPGTAITWRERKWSRFSLRMRQAQNES